MLVAAEFAPVSYETREECLAALDAAMAILAGRGERFAKRIDGADIWIDHVASPDGLDCQFVIIRPASNGEKWTPVATRQPCGCAQREHG